MNNALPIFVKITGYIPYIITLRPKIYYEDRAKQSRRIRGKAIVMPNHHKIWDTMTVMHVFPMRNMRCVISELICVNKFFTWFMANMGYIVTDRANKDFTFLTKAENILDKGGVVELYPEGRLPLPGEETPLEFKPSITYLALQSGAPIIPVVTNGSFFKKERMRSLIGTPIYVRELYDDNLSERENIDNITKYLRSRIKELNDELEKRTKNSKRKKLNKKEAEDQGDSL